jgi:very-short-patch-repair endonuclease
VEAGVGHSIPAVERAIARIASRQKGLITWRQLLAAGVSRSSIKRRLRDGRLHPVFRGVYLVGHEAMAPLARELAAVLAYEPHAFLSHRSAVSLWQLLPRVPDTVDVTVVGRHSGGQPGTKVHRSKPLHPADRTRLHNIPTTTPARTLLDFAETRPEHRDLERAFSEAQARSLITPKQIERLLARSTGRRGARPLRHLYERANTSTKSHSELEELLLHLIRQACLPEPAMNVVLLGRYKVDFLFRDHKTIAEADGGGWHSSQQRKDRDNRRDSELRLAGYKVERFTDHELTHQPHAAIVRLTRAIYA